MVSLNGFRKDYLRLNFPVDEIVRQYKDWASEDTYMILSKWNKEEWKNDVFAVKCAKRGNDVYRCRVERRFRGLSHKAEALEFFNPGARGACCGKTWLALGTYELCG